MSLLVELVNQSHKHFHPNELNKNTVNKTISHYFYRIAIMKEARQRILSQIEIIAKKPRFGLFSQPPPTALCDDSLFRSKHANKGEDGKPKTKPRNMFAGINRTGAGRRAFIDYPQSIYQKDPYKDPFKIELEYSRKIHGKSSLHQNQFKSTSRVKTITNSSYEHIEEKESKGKRMIKRDSNGKVKTEPANILTSPTSKIEVKLFHPVEHLKDQYDRAKEIANQEHLEWRRKIKGEFMFRSTSHGGDYFSKDRLVFGIDDKSRMLLSQKKPFKFTTPKKLNHEVRFKLARRGHGDPIGRYPQFIEPKERVKTEGRLSSRTKSKSAERQEWRPSTGELTRPTPSIVLMARNLRKKL